MRKYGGAEIRRVFSRPGEHHSAGDAAKLLVGSYVLYAWDLASNAPGHYIALVDGMLKCDKFLKSGTCNVKPLTEMNVHRMFYYSKTSAIMVWEVIMK